jgi:hypothetical protein
VTPPPPLPGWVPQRRPGGVWTWQKAPKRPTKRKLSQAEQRHVRAVREKAERAMFTDAELRAAHAAHHRGDTSPRTMMGERIYNRNKARRQREKAT